VLDADRDQATPTRAAACGAGHEQRAHPCDLDTPGEHHHVAGERREGGARNADEQRTHLAGAAVAVQQEEQPGAGGSEPERGAGKIEPQQIGDPCHRRPKGGLDAAGPIEECRLHSHQGDRPGDPDAGDDPGRQRLPRREGEDDDRRGHQRSGYQCQLEPTAQHRDATSRCGPAPALRPLWRSTDKPPSQAGGCDRIPCIGARTASGSTGRG